MKKSDLVNGNGVQLRNGKLGLVINLNCELTIMFLNEKDIKEAYENLKNYDEDLKHNNSKEKDIVVVYESQGLFEARKMIWKRKEVLLSDIEKTILGNMSKKIKYIARDEDGELFVFEYKPKKGKASWYDGNTIYRLDFYNHLFDFIKWEDSEPYLIDDLVVRD